jgi:hypothetical protein
MEYLNGNIHDARPPVSYTEEGKYGPCETIPPADRLVCYRRLPNWWALVFKGSDDDRLNLLETNCLGISDAQARDACFVGVGYNETSHTNFDPERSTRICEALRSQHEMRTCQYGGALAIFENTSVRERALRMCPVGDLRQCISAAEQLIGASQESLVLPD